jgi:hypothetical protein
MDTKRIRHIYNISRKEKNSNYSPNWTSAAELQDFGDIIGCSEQQSSLQLLNSPHLCLS